jgi:RNA polymerase sigma-70 factor, ECF subfamily
MRRTRHVTVDLSGRHPGGGIDRASLSDAVLVARARGGDRASLDALVARHQPGIERIARRRLRDPEDARDAAQDALARVVEHLPGFRGESEFATWVHRIAVNACTDHARRLERRRRAEAPGVAPEAAGLDDTVGAGLPEALGRLSAAQRRVVVMKDVLSMRYEEVARLMELPIGTVRCHAHRGRKRLAEHLRRPA